MVSGNITDGIRSVMKAEIESYLISPFYDKDFEHKLRIAIKKNGWFENLYSIDLSH